MKTIGVLAIQGDFARHVHMVNSLGYQTKEIRTPVQLDDTDALIIPGGESTTFLKIFNNSDFFAKISHYAKKHPIMGTCAGLIILSKKANALPQKSLGLIDIDAERNAYGRQRESFIADISINLNCTPNLYSGVFIRAPKILRIGSGVTILGKYKDEPVIVEEGNIMVCTFHPELTEDTSIHKYFLNKHLDNQHNTII